MSKTSYLWLTAAVAAFLLGLSTMAAAEEPMMPEGKLRIEAGGGIVIGDPDVEFQGQSDELDTDTGYAAGAAVWVDGLLFQHLSLGVQYLRMAGNDFEDTGTGTLVGPGFVATGTATVAAEPTINAFMANAALRKNDGTWHPYIGGGIGVAASSADISISGSGTLNGVPITGSASDDDSDTSFAGQVFGGIDIDLTEHIYAGVNGRYFITNADLFGADVEFRNFVGMGVVGVRW